MGHNVKLLPPGVKLGARTFAVGVAVLDEAETVLGDDGRLQQGGQVGVERLAGGCRRGAGPDVVAVEGEETRAGRHGAPWGTGV